MSDFVEEEDEFNDQSMPIEGIDYGYVSIVPRRHPPTIMYRSTIRASLRREALVRHGQVTRELGASEGAPAEVPPPHPHLAK